MIGTYFEYPGARPKSVTNYLISNTLKCVVEELGLQAQGINPNQVASHSLRSGGAMALHLNGVSDNVIKKLGRWSSDTFLIYIHEQIAVFSKGLSTKMSNEIPFHNVSRADWKPMPKIPILWESTAAA